MSGIAPLGPGAIPPADYNQYRSNGSSDAGRSTAGRIQRGDDSVELSPAAQRLALLDRVLHDPPVRQELIDRVREEIESGRYDSSEKIERVVEELWSDLFADDSSAG